MAYCASAAIPKQFITEVCGEWAKEDVFIENVKYGSETSRINIASPIRNLVTWISKLFEGPNTPSEKLIDYEAVQVANGYHEIFCKIFLPSEGNDLLYFHIRT